MRRPGWRSLALPVVTGAAVAATFLDFSLYPLAWVSFVPLLWGLGTARTQREAAWIGVAAGFATNVPAFYWLVYTMRVFGGFPYPIAVFFYACLSAYSACQFVLFALGMRVLGPGTLGLAAPLLWVALEFLYPNLFPWRMANTQFHVPVLTQIGDVTGPFALSFVIVWVSAGLVAALRRPRRWAPLASALAGVGGIALYGALRMPAIEEAIDAAPAVRVGLVQGNVGIVEKSDASYFEVNIERYRRLSRPLQADVDLLIWPESVWQQWVPAAAARLSDENNPFPGVRSPLLFGGLAYAVRGPEQVEKYNSAFLITPEGRILGRYDKQILMPFGEYLPGASLIPELAELSPHTGDFTPGRRIVTLDVPGKVRVAPLICYEDVPAGIARAMTQRGAEALLTIFNDAWFGRSAAPYQHEALALWRAIENRRYFLRVGNAGVTGVVDPFGRVLSRLGLFTEEALVAEIKPLRVMTFYTRYGNVFGWLVVSIAGTWLAWASLRSQKPEVRSMTA